MANQKLSDFTTAATAAAAGDLLLLENSATHKKITFANLTKDIIFKTGTPVADRIAIFTGANNIKGISGLKMDGSTLIVEGALRLSDQTQDINTVSLQLNQSQIQSLNTVPVQIIADPGANKYIQIMGGSVFYNHNGTDYVGGVAVYLEYPTGNVEWIANNIIDQSTDKLRHFQLNANNIEFSDSIQIISNLDSTGAGGTITVSVQYVIKDTT